MELERQPVNNSLVTVIDDKIEYAGPMKEIGADYEVVDITERQLCRD